MTFQKKPDRFTRGSNFIFASLALLMLFSSTVFLSSCEESDSAPEPEILPTTVSNDNLTLEPGSGRPGEEITIKGSNFPSVINDNIVLFNGKNALVKSIHLTDGSGEIVVVVPFDATSGTVEILNLKEDNIVGPEFTVLGPHTITEISPSEGEAGTELVISGTFFSTNANENVVYIGSDRLEVIEATETELKVIIPENRTSGRISVSILGLEVYGSVYTSLVESQPRILLVSPPAGPIGTRVVIRGALFSEIAENNIVSFGKLETPVLSTTNNGNEIELIVLVPDGASSGALVVNVDGMETRWNTHPFGYADPLYEDRVFEVSNREPWVNGLSLLSNLYLPGYQFTFQGTGFSPEPSFNKVTVGETELRVIESTGTGTFLRAEIPTDIDFGGESSISGPLVITVNGKRFEAENSTLLIYEKPVFNMSSNNRNGQMGDEITIAAIVNFTNIDSNMIDVWFEGHDDAIETQITLIDNNKITVVVPEGAITGKISLQVYGGEIAFSATDFEVIN